MNDLWQQIKRKRRAKLSIKDMHYALLYFAELLLREFWAWFNLTICTLWFQSLRVAQSSNMCQLILLTNNILIWYNSFSSNIKQCSLATFKGHSYLWDWRSGSPASLQKSDKMVLKFWWEKSQKTGMTWSIYFSRLSKLN